MINKNNYEIYFLDYHEGTLPAEKVAELFLFLELHPEYQEEFDAFDNIKLTDDLTEEFPGKELLRKSEINADNIQQYLIAELEGDLNADEQKALNDFLAVNKQFEKDRLLYSKTRIVDAETVVFPAKDALKKLIGDEHKAQQLLIAETEGDITLAEQVELNKLLKDNPQLERDRKLYAKTKLTADTSITYPNKGELKKTVALFNSRSLVYTISIAASILIFLGVYFYSAQDINPTPKNVVATNSIINQSENNKGSNTLKQNSSANPSGINSVIPNTANNSPSEKSLAAQNNNKKQKDEIQVAHNPKQHDKNNSGQETKEELKNVPEQNMAENKNQPQPNNLIPNNVEQQPLAQNNAPVNPEPKTTIIITQPDFEKEKNANLKQTVENLAGEQLAKVTGNEQIKERKNKKLNALNWAVNKIGGNKVKMETSYDADDNVADISVTSKGFSIEHSRGF